MVPKPISIVWLQHMQYIAIYMFMVSSRLYQIITITNTIGDKITDLQILNVLNCYMHEGVKIFLDGDVHIAHTNIYNVYIYINVIFQGWK